MHGSTFLLQQHRLKRRGFAVRRFSYPSMLQGLAHNTALLARFIDTTSVGEIHLLGHSLGGLLALSMLQQYPNPRVRRVVLMGSPCMGCHCAAMLQRVPGLGRIIGHTLQDWLALPRPQLSDQIEIGVLSGNRNLGLGCMIPGLKSPNDGVVAVTETHWPEAKDFITLPVSHAQMLVSSVCAAQVAVFLDTGRFTHEASHP